MIISPKEKAEKALPKNHMLGMRVSKGGSKCANCRFLASETACGNKAFVKWNDGRAELPAPKDSYCCDLWESKKHQAALVLAHQAKRERGNYG